LPRLISNLANPQSQLTITRPRKSHLTPFVGKPVLPGAEIDHVGVDEGIARAGIDYSDDQSRRLLGVCLMAS
jgi:hypothetical protein